MPRVYQYQFGGRPRGAGGWVFSILATLLLVGIVAAAVVFGAALLAVGLVVSGIAALGFGIRRWLTGETRSSLPPQPPPAPASDARLEVREIEVDEIVVESKPRQS